MYIANAIVPRASKSAVTNGRPFLGRVDGRSAPARRLRDIKNSLLDRLGNAPTAHQVLMIEGAASVELQIELLRSKQARGEIVDSVVLIKLANALRRFLRDLALSETDADA